MLTLSELGISDEMILALEDYVAGHHYDEKERAALEYGDTIILSGRVLDDELFGRVEHFFDGDALVELRSVIAWENASSKFNRALRVPYHGLWRQPKDRRKG